MRKSDLIISTELIRWGVLFFVIEHVLVYIILRETADNFDVTELRSIATIALVNFCIYVISLIYLHNIILKLLTRLKHNK